MWTDYTHTCFNFEGWFRGIKERTEGRGGCIYESVNWIGVYLLSNTTLVDVYI